MGAKQLGLFDSAGKGPRSAKRGKRRGRKVRSDRIGFAIHRTRPLHEARHPVHITMRRVRLGPNLRAEIVRAAIVAQLHRVKQRNRVRVIHYSIQENHLHLMVEGPDRADLGRQTKVLFSRIAMAVNRVAMRSGKLFVDRHHRHDLTTPTEVRRALVYILFNDRKHLPSAAPKLDEASSTRWLPATDWLPTARPPPSAHTSDKPPTTRPETWLARVGWRRSGGPLRFNEHPRPALPRAQ
jgi:REP element-mobilizing transposase RayT